MLPAPRLLLGTAPSPWGTITLLSDGVALLRLQLPESRWPLAITATMRTAESLPLFAHTRTELAAYFAGALQRFTLPCAAQGTALQVQVWQALAAIPYGETRSYSDLAAELGRPQAVRAVASANARNPLPLIVPCHRVIGKNGTLSGYSGGGIARKAELLALEGATQPRSPRASPH
jgi:methylated-DNA-[protein]-cysteine S-methyltransferase